MQLPSSRVPHSHREERTSHSNQGRRGSFIACSGMEKSTLLMDLSS